MIEKIKTYCRDPKNTTTVDVALFIILIMSFHYLYLLWQHFGYWPLGETINRLFVDASTLLFNQCCWTLQHIFGQDIETFQHTIRVMNNDDYWSYVTVAPECTSLKQWLHWLFLMLLFPGPWKHKLWYIPLGLVIIELTNVLRVTGILLLLIPFPENFDFFHNYIFKIFFYVIIFLMWMIWEEKFRLKKKKR